jgi:hypothetical protein
MIQTSQRRIVDGQLLGLLQDARQKTHRLLALACKLQFGFQGIKQSSFL